jgi:hypothetical protein
MRNVREHILVTKGNNPIFPGGPRVFSDPDPVYGGGGLVPVDGQLAIFDNHSQVSLDNVSLLGRPYATLATFHDSDGDGMAETMRKAFGDKIFVDNVFAYTAEGCRCAIQEVTDFLFSCTHCSQPYTLTMIIQDNETQNQYPYNKGEQLTFTSNQECCSCSDCPEDSDVSCKIAQDLINQINGVLTTNPLKVPTFNRPAPKNTVKAVRLYGGAAASKLYTLEPVETDGCTNCTAVPFVKSFTYDIGDGNGTITVTFTNNADPADGTQTLIGQLPGIVNQINQALDGKGHAILRRGITACCPITLEINTCATAVTVKTTGDVNLVAVDSNPLAPLTLGGQCVNCGDQSLEETTFEYGIRVIADPVIVNTRNGDHLNRPLGVTFRKVDLYPSGGFSCGGAYVRKTQKVQIAENMGYQWAWREYASATGTSGRDVDGFNKNYGPIGLPGSKSRYSAGFVDPDEQYCSYVIQHGLPFADKGPIGALRVSKGRTVILVPQADTVTQASIESTLGPWILSANNGVWQSAICGTDQDQIQNDETDPEAVVEAYFDMNGMIF